MITKEGDECYTPKWIFETIGLTFDLDVASPVNHETYVPALKKYTVHDNGLAQNWEGNVWMNPPYSKPKPWVEKFIEHGNGIALLPLSLSYWSKAIWNSADAVTLTERQPKFLRPDGTHQGIRFPTFLFAIGENNVKALNNFTEYKVR